jgi:hypothetical protein
LRFLDHLVSLSYLQTFSHVGPRRWQGCASAYLLHHPVDGASSLFVRFIVAERVEFVVPHHDLCGTGAKHPFNNLDHLTNRWTAIDQLADENRLAIWRAIDAAGLFIPKTPQ